MYKNLWYFILMTVCIKISADEVNSMPKTIQKELQNSTVLKSSNVDHKSNDSLSAGPVLYSEGGPTKVDTKSKPKTLINSLYSELTNESSQSHKEGPTKPKKGVLNEQFVKNGNKSKIEVNVVKKPTVTDLGDKPDETPGVLKSVNSDKKLVNQGHPGLVVPVVITMIAVPVFAALSFLALRRGREAWNNRHYSRMDYLLDGMYND